MHDKIMHKFDAVSLPQAAQLTIWAALSQPTLGKLDWTNHH